jgi:DNA repair protein RadC
MSPDWDAHSLPTMILYEAKITYSIVQLGENFSIQSPEDAVKYLTTHGGIDEIRATESLWVIGLDVRGRPIARIMITLGTLTQSLVEMREVFRPLIMMNAAAFILAHNHPSGASDPSSADIRITRTTAEAGRIIGIPLKDHVIIGYPAADNNPKGFYSFSSSGLI